jgi:hypothetical protein
LRFLFLAIVMLIFSGCPGDPCTDDLSPTLVLGGGIEGFRAIEDGDILPVERGSQGGQHIWLSIIGDGMHPGSQDVSEGLRKDDLPWISFEMHAPDGTYSNDNLLRQPLQEIADGGWGFLERRVSFRYWSVLPDDWTEIPREQREAELEAMDFVVSGTIEDACGDVITAHRIVGIAFP